MLRVARFFSLLGTVALLGCSFQPMPLVVAQGTTFTILVSTGFGPGFGRTITGDPWAVAAWKAEEHDVDREDLQRGELIFQLVPFGTPPNIDGKDVDEDGMPDPVAGVFLPREFVTRIRVDNTARDAFGDDLFYEGQALAVLQMPSNVAPDQYEIYVWRFRRSDIDGSFERVDTYWKVFSSGADGGPWTGWGTAFADRGIPITVVPAGDCNYIWDPTAGHTPQYECFTSHIGWARGGVWAISGEFTDADLREMTPYPSLQIESPVSSNSNFAAWEMTVDYPLEKLEIKGVSAYGSRSSQSIVMWQVGNPDPQDFDCANGSTDQLHVQVVSPERAASQVLVAFELRPENFLTSGPGSPCAAGGRAELDDFSVQVTGYDVDGEPVASPGVELHDDYML